MYVIKERLPSTPSKPCKPPDRTPSSNTLDLLRVVLQEDAVGLVSVEAEAARLVIAGNLKADGLQRKPELAISSFRETKAQAVFESRDFLPQGHA